MSTTVSEIMSRDLACVSPDATIETALATLLRANAAEVYVTDAHQRLLGVVPDYELLKAHLGGVEMTAGVTTLMTRGVVVFGPNLDLLEAARIFRDCRHARVAIAAEGRLLGQISRRDVLQRLAGRPSCTGESPRESTADATFPGLAARPQFLNARSRDGILSGCFGD